jgi:peptidoglycan glycosyltransferase
MKNNILKLSYLLLGLFMVLLLYLSYLQLIKGPVLAANPYNRRLYELEAQVRRGTIFDINGVALAKTEYGEGQSRRVYPEGAAAAHLVGYISERYGRAGLESAYDSYLLGMEGNDRTRNLINRFLGREQAGGDVFLTIDAGLQELALDLLGGRRGAVVMLDPGTGAIMAMVSSPGYDPNRLDEIWSGLVQDSSSPLLNRAAQGAYPPGSIFKVVTAAGALAADPGLATSIFNCPGFLEVEGYKLTDLAAHGEVDLRKALAVSCNTTFARLGLSQKAAGFQQAFKAFGLAQDPGLGVPVRSCTMASKNEMTAPELASSAIGQGQLLVSPFHMALVASAIANEGTIMQPYLVDSVRDSAGFTLHRAAQRSWQRATTPGIAGMIKEGMIAAVEDGTARAAGLPGMQVAGKTGSAQNPHGPAHAWFIGFAPAEQPRMAVAVVLENAGAGGALAAPIAGELMAAAASRGY